MRKIAVFAVITALAVLFALALPAQAVPVGVFAINGKASLNSGFPCTVNCYGTFSGKGNGAGVDSVTKKVILCKGCVATASYTYREPSALCIAGKPAAPLGTANGTFKLQTLVGGVLQPTSINFSWTRVGATAVVLLSQPTGVGVGGFVPPPTCTPNQATVATVAAIG